MEVLLLLCSLPLQVYSFLLLFIHFFVYLLLLLGTPKFRMQTATSSNNNYLWMYGGAGAINLLSELWQFETTSQTWSLLGSGSRYY